MKNKQKNAKQLKFSAEIVGPWRRILSALGDLFAFYIVSAFVFMLAIFPLVKALPSFRTSLVSQEKALEVCRDIYVDGHLMYLDSEGEALSKEEVITKYIKSKIPLEDYVGEEYSDMFYYFYLSYANENLTYKDVAYHYDESFLINDIFNIYNQEEPFLWDSTYSGPVRLTSEAKTKLEQYLNNDVTSENLKYYNKIIDFCKTNLVEAEKVAKNSDQYKKSYSIVIKENDVLFYHFTISASITYTVFFFLYFLLVPALLKDGQTLLKRVLQIKIVDRKNEPIKFKTLLLRSVMQYVSYSFLTLFIPYLILGTSIFNLPMITIAGVTINFFIFAILTFVLTIASLVITFCTEYNQSLIDKASDTYCLDMRNVFPIEEDKENSDSGSII